MVYNFFFTEEVVEGGLMRLVCGRCRRLPLPFCGLSVRATDGGGWARPAFLAYRVPLCTRPGRSFVSILFSAHARGSISGRPLGERRRRERMVIARRPFPGWPTEKKRASAHVGTTVA